MKLRAIVTAAAAIAVGAVCTILGPASPALGFYSPPLLLDVQIDPSATLVAKGAGVEVRLQVICAGATSAWVSVDLTERAGSEIASGHGETVIGCTGQLQTVTVTATAYSGKSFKKGSAITDGYVGACSSDYYYPVCGNEKDTRTVDISQ